MNKKKIVFISCGQITEEEKTLGKKICDLVTELTPFEPYFAQFQSSMEGVTDKIFNKLKEADGFITVMHDRGNVIHGEHSTKRGSVWIEQEIAIASFIVHSLHRTLNVASYVQQGIKLEGVRKYIMFNPIQFKDVEEVYNGRAKLDQKVGLIKV